MKLKFLSTLLVFLTIGMLAPVSAQVTTATIYGIALGDNGDALIGATVVATNTSSGIQYGTTTRDDGRYTLPNLRIGGPYTVQASYVGYESMDKNNIYLAIGQKMELDFNLKSSAQELGEVEVVAQASDLINSDRTGAQTTINSLQLQRMPTINRSAADFYRLTAASSGNSFLGRNDQFNNFSLDGSIFNNPFGLDAATPGGQTDAQPIPLDAIEQIQVSLSPFDVTYAGFTGASINAVTKSGTNEFHGTVYSYTRNQDLTGSKVNGNDITVPDLQQNQSGFSIGGPLIKNKLFFFANFEIERRENQGTTWLAARSGLAGENVSRVQASDLDAVSTALRTRFGYETGDYENYVHNTDNQKAIIKLDLNINQNHTLSLKYNWLDALRQKPAHPSAIGPRGPSFTTLQFRNSGYQINNKIHSGILELNSIIGNKASNKIQIGYTSFRDSRDPFSSPFPVVSIQEGGSRYIIAGHEPFSIHNILNQDVFQVTNNFNLYLGKHNLTIGAAFESFDFENSFNLNHYGGTFGDYSSTQAFLDSLNTGVLDPIVDAAKSAFETRSNEDWAWARPKVGQFSIYAQDEIELSNDFRLTIGLRVDAPLYFNTSEAAQDVIDDPLNCCYFPDIVYFTPEGEDITFDHTVLPDQKPLFSPRVGFNWDVNGDQTFQLRGGSGLFTGRFPFVWIGNHVGNPNFFFYNYTLPDFKFPQVWKTNLGYDRSFGDGWATSVDLIYTKDINSMMVRNYGLKPPSATLEGVDNRQVYDQVADRTGFGNNAYVFTNSDKGYSFNATAQITRHWGEDFFTSLSYNFGISKDVSSIEAEISSDAYDRNPAIGHVNDDVLAHSIYGNRHRIVGSGYKKWTYGNMATTVATFFEITEGGRFSYTYSGDINGDGSGLNDLIYIPTDGEIDQMVFGGDDPAGQRTALKAYIAQDDYLSGRRGDYAEKYGVLSPWFTNWDLRILQDISFGGAAKKHTIQLSLDFLNFGNLISSKWGVRQFPTNTQPISYLGNDANNQPIYNFDSNLTKSFVDDFSLRSRWQLQVGLRYIF